METQTANQHRCKKLTFQSYKNRKINTGLFHYTIKYHITNLFLTEQSLRYQTCLQWQMTMHSNDVFRFPTEHRKSTLAAARQ